MKMLISLKEVVNRPKPAWHVIKNGPNKGNSIFLDLGRCPWFQEMVEGIFDGFIYRFLEKYNLSNKCIYEVGAHVGYHSMGYASLVGSQGKVIVFEPNPFNRERLMLNVKKNSFENFIQIQEEAISDSNASLVFNLSRKTR